MDNTLAILDFAMTMEQEGKFFFAEWSGRVKNPATKEIFQELAKWEEEHWKYLASQRSALEQAGQIVPGEAPIAAAEKKALDTFYLRAKGDARPKESTSCMSDLSALRLAITIEHDLHEFYGNASAKAADPALKEMFAMLSRWEQNHREILENEYAALKEQFWSEMGFQPF